MIALTRTQLALLDDFFLLLSSTPSPPRLADTLYIAKLGGYLARARDPIPGNIVIWRGLFRLRDLAIGYSLRRTFVGN